MGAKLCCLSRIKADDWYDWDSDSGKDARKKEEIRRKEEQEYAKKRQQL